MQINGAQLAIAFSPKSSEPQKTSRIPVTVDAKPTLELSNNTTAPSKPEFQPNQQQITANDAQQARFVRLLSTDNESGSQPESNSLPASVQQYLQIADLSSGSVQRLFDETV